MHRNGGMAHQVSLQFRTNQSPAPRGTSVCGRLLRSREEPSLCELGASGSSPCARAGTAPSSTRARGPPSPARTSTGPPRLPSRSAPCDVVRATAGTTRAPRPLGAPCARRSSASTGRAASRAPGGRTRATSRRGSSTSSSVPRARRSRPRRAERTVAPPCSSGSWSRSARPAVRLSGAARGARRPATRSPSSSPRLRPVESATTVILRAVANQNRSSSSAAASSVPVGGDQVADRLRVHRLRLDHPSAGGFSTRSSGFSDTHRHRLAVLNISPARTRWFRTVFGESPSADLVGGVPLEHLR